MLRYLSRLFKVLSRGVPDRFKTEAVFDQLGYFHSLLNRVDSSLLNEWERLWSLEAAVDGPGVLNGSVQHASQPTAAGHDGVDGPGVLNGSVSIPNFGHHSSTGQREHHGLTGTQSFWPKLTSVLSGRSTESAGASRAGPSRSPADCGCPRSPTGS